jgi:alpha-amylase/alpha-mannosidase (GH57 family)
VAADHYHQTAFGVANGIAQTYNHTILPLATRRDKVTQIAWGIADFWQRFGHRPAGMWLPEMAVDLDTLEILADQGLEYTLLSAHQVRGKNGGPVDSSRPCSVELAHGRRFAVYLRNDEISNRLAFDQGFTANANSFVQYCRATMRGSRGLLVLATAGETFGHHLPERQYFLQSLLRSEASGAGFRITTPGEYHIARSQQQRVELVENTSWSCSHGVARWSTGCACSTGDQTWKDRLRTALDRLAGAIDALYASACARWIDDPWELRDSYIQVILNKIQGEQLLDQFSRAALPSHNARSLLLLLEAQRHRLAMYASDGWFFDDLSRIEARSNLGHAALAVELTSRATGIDLTSDLRNDLAAAKSWLTDETGREILDRVTYERQI